jgi:primary-amine oxidase
MAVTPAKRVYHPLDPLSAEEIRRAVNVVQVERGLGGRIRFVSVTLLEPPKEAVYGFCEGDEIERQAKLVLLDGESESAYEAMVSVTSGELREWRERQDIQPAIIAEEFQEVEQLVLAHPAFREALRRRGINRIELVTVDPIHAGNFGFEEERGRRLCRALAWMRPRPNGNSYSRPLEGIVALVDLHRMEVVRIDDNGAVPIPLEEGEYAADRVGPLRSDVKPFEIIQPEGPSFEVSGNEVRWQRWTLRIGFTAREGLVLHTVAYDGRPIMYRASYTEAVVPYGDPSPNHFIQASFDMGESLLGTLANSLELGCDCLGVIRYFDAVVANSRGEPVTIRNAICLHEEDVGLLWKHLDLRTGEVEVRRSRRLVLSSMSSLGNYEYGFYWFLYQDGTIESEVKATGILTTAAVPPGERPAHGTLVAPGLNAMVHQHFFSVRLDMSVEGEENSVYDVYTESIPPGPENPCGNAFAERRRLLLTELGARGTIDPLSARSWLIVNQSIRNALGEPVAYRLVPGDNVARFAQPDSSFAQRAGFVDHHVWVTPFDPAECYATGDYPNQHPGGAGLPDWTARDRRIENTDIVLWYTFGHHHIPRPEDWPVLPVVRIGFALKPFGFFDRNPALDVPPPTHGSL